VQVCCTEVPISVRLEGKYWNLLEKNADECESLTIGIHPQKQHKKEGTTVSDLQIIIINPVTGTVICRVYKCQRLDEITKWVALYLYSHSGTLGPVIGRTLLYLTYPYHIQYWIMNPIQLKWSFPMTFPCCTIIQNWQKLHNQKQINPFAYTHGRDTCELDRSVVYTHGCEKGF
jgi:hypothetical protein